MLTLEWKDGSQDVFADLAPNGAFVDDDYAKDHNLQVGSSVVVETPSGEKLRLVVRGIFDPPTGGSPFGHVTFASSTFDRAYPNPENLFTFLKMQGGDTPENSAALEKSLADFPNAKSQTRDEFVDNQIAPLKNILNILYVLLALSVFVSFFGIINTLVLTVFERTRELGMLRAVGMTRRQVRRMIRHESVITALIGGALGLLLGIALGGLLIARIDFILFTSRGAARRSSRSQRSSSASLPRSSRRAARRGSTRWRRCSTSRPLASSSLNHLTLAARHGGDALRRRAADGLQNEPETLAPDVRAELVRRLAATGLPRIEAVSFVNPERVPQMAGAEEVVAEVGNVGSELSGLVLNERGWERLATTTLARVNVTLAATEQFNLRNGNATLAEATERVERILGVADRPATATISVAFGCPFEGEVDPGWSPTWPSGSSLQEPARSSSRTRSASRRLARSLGPSSAARSSASR